MATTHFERWFADLLGLSELEVKRHLRTAPAEDLAELEQALSGMHQTDRLAHLPPKVIQVAPRLYVDDIAASRAVLAPMQSRENELMLDPAEGGVNHQDRCGRDANHQQVRHDLLCGHGNLWRRGSSECAISSGLATWLPGTYRQWPHLYHVVLAHRAEARGLGHSPSSVEMLQQ